MKFKTLFLRAALLFLVAAVSLLGIFWFWQIVKKMLQIYPGIGWAAIVFGVAIYVSALLFFGAVFYAWKILNLVDQENTFSAAALVDLRRLKLFILGMAAAYACFLPAIFVVGDQEDAPGIILMFGLLVGLPLVVATFIGILEKLLQRALFLQVENDLTV